ncbi:MAG: hypothetical protein R6W75_09865 [Smithellaceae bacterium]
MSPDSGKTEEKKIYDLTDVYDEHEVPRRRSTDVKANPNVIVIDGRVYEKVRQNKTVHELTDVVEEPAQWTDIHEAVAKQITEITEKIAREMIPGIADRVIREEIENLRRKTASEVKD